MTVEEFDYHWHQWCLQHRQRPKVLLMHPHEACKLAKATHIAYGNPCCSTSYGEVYEAKSENMFKPRGVQIIRSWDIKKGEWKFF
jgi:hypothetical protein